MVLDKMPELEESHGNPPPSPQLGALVWVQPAGSRTPVKVRSCRNPALLLGQSPQHLNVGGLVSAPLET